MKRTLDTIIGRAHTLGVRAEYHYWTEEENDILRKYYPIERYKIVDRFPYKKPYAVMNQIRNLNITIRGDNYYWTEEEDNILRQYYAHEGASGCAKRLVSRNKNACQGRARALQLEYVGNWTDDELQILYDRYPAEGSNCFTSITNHTRSACISKASELGLKCLKVVSKWTPEEDEILKTYWSIEGKDTVARLPNHNLVSCKNRAFKLGLKMPDTKSKKVLCIETGEIFVSCSEASRIYHCGDLSPVLKGRKKSAGKLPDGTKLHWKYIEEEK